MRIKPYRYPELPPAECQVCGRPRTPGHPCDLKVSYQQWGNGYWKGTLKLVATEEIVAVTVSAFRNRDQGNSAINAAARVLAELQMGGRA